MSSEAAATTQPIQSQSELIRKNVSAIAAAQGEEAGKRTALDHAADGITAFSGSMIFVFAHVVWFGFWILLNVGLVHIPNVSEFDPYPFGLLTMIVSLEAIFLSTFVLISQNRMSQQSEKRAELDLHVNLLAEQKATKALEMLDQIIQQMNTLDKFNFEHDPEVKVLKVSPEPHEVLGVMKDAVEQEAAEVKQEVRGEVKRAVGEISAEMEAVREEVKDNTGETKAIRGELKGVDKKVEEVADNVQAMKEEFKKEIKEELSAK